MLCAELGMLANLRPTPKYSDVERAPELRRVCPISESSFEFSIFEHSGGAPNEDLSVDENLSRDRHSCLALGVKSHG